MSKHPLLDEEVVEVATLAIWKQEQIEQRGCYWMPHWEKMNSWTQDRTRREAHAALTAVVEHLEGQCECFLDANDPLDPMKFCDNHRSLVEGRPTCNGTGKVEGKLVRKLNV